MAAASPRAHRTAAATRCTRSSGCVRRSRAGQLFHSRRQAAPPAGPAATLAPVCVRTQAQGPFPCNLATPPPSQQQATSHPRAATPELAVQVAGQVERHQAAEALHRRYVGQQVGHVTHVPPQLAQLGEAGEQLQRRVRHLRDAMQGWAARFALEQRALQAACRGCPSRHVLDGPEAGVHRARLHGLPRAQRPPARCRWRRPGGW